MSIYDELVEAGCADIYTDAPECEESVEGLRNLIHNAAQHGRATLAERDALLAALREIVANDPFNQSSAGIIASKAIAAVQP